MELKLGSIPLRIQGSFLLMALLLGLNQRDPLKLAVWVAAILVSVTIHELGHALTGKAFGLEPRIELYGMGGLTSFSGGRSELSAVKSVAVSLAGPFAGFLFGFAIYVAERGGLQPKHPLAEYAVSILFFANIWWGVFNLLPMLPLDGGNVMRTILQAITKGRGERAARVLSIVVAAGVVLLAVRSEQWWILYLGALFAFQNVQALRQAGQLKVDQTLADAIKAGYAALDRKQPREAIVVLEPALASAATPELRQVALRIYVIALLKEGQWTDAMNVIERERAVIGSEDLGRYAQMMRELGRHEDSARIEQLGKAPAPLSEFRA